MVFVGYTQTTKQYRLYNPAARRIVISRDLVFHEDTLYFGTTHQKIFLPFANEPDLPPPSRDEAPVSTIRRGLRRIPLPPLPPLPWPKLSSTPESAERKARMNAREESDKKDEASGPVRKRRIYTGRVTNRGPFSDTVEEDDRQIRGEAAESSSVGGSRSRSRRSSRGSRRDGNDPEEDAVNAGIDYTFMVTNGPESINTASRGAYREEWIKAINSEPDSHETHDTWTVVPATDEMRDLRTISSRMVLQEKLGEEGRVARFKARLVAHGFGQRSRVDFIETYCPGISLPAIQMVLSKAAAEDKEIVELDIVTAFLESKIQEEIYLQLPKEFGVSSGGKIVLHDGYNGAKSGTRTTNVVVQ